MARSVYDVAATLGVMVGVDPADVATERSDGRNHNDYTQFLDADALDGARIGVVRDFMDSDPEVDWIMEAALETMRDAGAEIVDVELPPWLLESRGKFYRAIRYREFRAQIEDYLATIGSQYPKTLAELIKESKTLTAKSATGMRPNPSRWNLMLSEEEGGELTGLRIPGSPRACICR